MREAPATGRLTAKLEALGSLGVLVKAEETLARPGRRVPRHIFHDHTPVWAYENPRLQRPWADASRLLFEILPAGLGPDEVAARTRFIVFLGAADSPEFEAFFARGDCLTLLFEPSAEVLGEFLDRVRPRDLARRKGCVFLGDPAEFPTPLAALVPEGAFAAGFPVFYVQEGLAGALPEYVAGLVEQIEFLFWRSRVYPVEGQQCQRSLPLREIKRGAMYDQQLHYCANLSAYLRHPSIAALKDALAGETAVLVAAGPDMERRLPLLRRLRERAVIIAVHRALPVLLKNGVHPHFTVINDSSMAAGAFFDRLPERVPSTLVAHCLCALGEDRFDRTFLFGNVFSEVFGERPGLRVHGSVITAAYSLAAWLGCARCVLVGAQLSGNDPWKLGYTPSDVFGGGADGAKRPERPLTGAWPQLYPVDTPTGRLYTTLNFRDAALWLLDEIRAQGVPCVNTTAESIIRGAGVTFEEEPEVPDSPGMAARLAGLAETPPPAVDRARVLAHAAAEMFRWRTIALTAGHASAELHAALVDAQALVGTGVAMPGSLGNDLPSMVNKAMEILGTFDKDTVSGLLERYPDFSHPRFHALVFAAPGGAPGGVPYLLRRAEGLVYYFDNVAAMARGFCRVLAGQLERIGRLG
ncbi:6-hydroxymethylpterin diphosphokinase MptE-like protein [Desulfovibrio sp. X2]|uniref:6-hydroxymethylpterin diphosphokinase MptE-like protein n=1 Tax=Desulfovibrio sp. X2 TaxID=941449 RepID=UPI000558B38B|nr:6-hydroxymethylpterin diphosphokinase MptE-like protein [Desulfovibrio sp. X2]